MKFKIRKTLNPRQLYRAKFTMVAGLIFVCLTFAQSQFFVSAVDEVDVVEEKREIKWFEQSYLSKKIVPYDRGSIIYYSTNKEVCDSWVLIPGTALIPNSVSSVAYGLTLIYLFLAINIISDIFMDGVEMITAQKKIVQIKDQYGQITQTKKVAVWNPTMANLTLMALGSSAPEILLSVIETVGGLGGCPGELGPSTIVGSAAFNLLVISGVSIYAVHEGNDNSDERDQDMPKGIKKIKDMGVFGVTATFSVFAYIWLFIVLLDQRVDPWEAWVTLFFFFLLLALAFAADRMGSGDDEEEEEALVVSQVHIDFTAVQVFKELVAEKSGHAGTDQESVERRERMKEFLKQSFKTDKIENIDKDELKKKLEGDSMLGRIKYRKQVGMMGKRPVIEKGQVLRQELASADTIDDKQKNPKFGFKCLHYSVSEASETLLVHIVNKLNEPGSVRVRTHELEAIAGKDFHHIDEVIQFKKGETQKHVTIKIIDDDNWEPDKDFEIHLLEPETQEQLIGKDTSTRVTIIDDDQPGQISYEEQGTIRAIATESNLEVVILRKNGCDGKLTIDYETLQLDETEHTATPGVDYVHNQGTIIFEHGETNKSINITILDRPDQDVRDDTFAIQLSNIFPSGAKLSKKSLKLVNIITDVETKKKQEALDQILKKIEDEEESTWGSQFIKACMLHPTKDEEGDIQPIAPMDGFLHLICIGWKLLFALVPPAHYCGGWACFICALGMIGIVTAVVGEFANLFGCVLNVEPSITAITFVALGTSLPDTFASMAAATAEPFADSAVGNVTGSNSVNVFLGLGLPWVIATMYYSSLPLQEGVPQFYFVPAGSLGFSVFVFCTVAIVCIIFLLIRRKVVGGELGGSPTGRLGSCMFLCSLWALYILMSILQVYNIGGLKDMTKGLVQNPDAKHPLAKCNK